MVFSADADIDNCYADALPLCCYSWRRFLPEFCLSCVIIGEKPFAHYWGKYGKWLDTMVVIKPTGGYSVSVIARTAREWYAGQFGNDIVTMEDVDVILLQRDWHVSLYSKYVPGRIMRVGAEYYDIVPHEKGKAPSGKLTMDSWMWQEVSNPRCLPYREWIDSFRGINIIDTRGREDPSKCDVFSHESLLRANIHRYEKPELVYDVVRNYDDPDIGARHKWAATDWERLRRGTLVEAHIPMPYYPNLVTVSEKLARDTKISEETPGILPLIKYLGFVEPIL